MQTVTFIVFLLRLSFWGKGMPYGLFRWGKGTFAPDSAGKIGKSDPVAGKKHGAAHAAVFRNGDGAGIEVISVFFFLKSRNVGVSADQHIAGGEGGDGWSGRSGGRASGKRDGRPRHIRP